MHVAVGDELWRCARETGAQSLVVVGTGKNVGKTVATRAMYEAALSTPLRLGLTSIGRDGEAIDVGDAQSKPRLFLRSGTYIATARDVLPRTPAAEIINLSGLRTAAGSLVYARVRGEAYFELVGPPTASGLREAIVELARHCDHVIVDGAIDRVAALAGGQDAVIVSCGAATSSTMEEAVEEVQALVARLCIPRYDGAGESIRVQGALTPTRVAEYVGMNERRAIVVGDPTQVALSGRSALAALSKLTIRCERPLRVVAVTVASIGRSNHFEPRDFARAVSKATALPTFDIYAGERVAC